MSPTRSSASIRRDALNTYYLQCYGLTSTTTCFYCLCRPPEHMLACRHAICDTCVVIFGTPNKSAEYHFDITKCALCHQASQLTIRQLPPTKRPLVLSLDGGGVRGIIQLGLLYALEKRLGHGMRISDIFDLSGGTSVGMCQSRQSVVSFFFPFCLFPSFHAPIPYWGYLTMKQGLLTK